MEGFGTSEQLLTHSSYWLPVVPIGDELIQRAWRNPDRLRTEDAAKSEPCTERLKNVGILYLVAAILCREESVRFSIAES